MDVLLQAAEQLMHPGGMLFDESQHVRLRVSSSSSSDRFATAIANRRVPSNGLLQVVTGGPGELPQCFIGAGQLRGSLRDSLFQFLIDLADSIFGLDLVGGVADGGGDQDSRRALLNELQVISAGNDDPSSRIAGQRVLSRRRRRGSAMPR